MLDIEKNKILVIDDDSILRTLLHKLLSFSGYEVDLAENGMHGLQRLKDKKYDLIISDVNMPEMDGLTLYSRLKEEDYPRLEDRFLFLTADSKNDTISFFTKNGCKYLPKPFGGRELLSEVDAILEK